MDKKNYIYGFDISIASPGCAIFDIDGNPIFFDSLFTNPKESTGKRLKAIATWVLDLREKYPPNKIIIERAFNRYNNVTAQLYRVHGVINMIFWDMEQIYYTPRDIKLTILKGTATKAELREKINTVYKNITFKSEDESDSCAVALSYFVKNKIIDWKK